jgi:hypothetical protein
MNTQLHPNAVLPLNFWSKATHVLWAIYMAALSHSSTFSWQFTAYRSINQFFINIAQLSYCSSCSSFPSISMTYLMQYSHSWPCAPGLSGDCSRWMYGWMQHDGGYSYRFALRSNHSLYDLYAMTELYCAGTFCLWYWLCILTYP